MSETKQKGTIAEIKILADLIQRGFTVSIPYGEDARYDLVVDTYVGSLIRVQCKYENSKNGYVRIKASSTNNWGTIKYTSLTVDLMAVYDAASGLIYYVPMSEFELEQYNIQLRLIPPKNNQVKKIRYASDYLNFPTPL